MADVYIGPIQHDNAFCQKTGCECWCQACERHNWRHEHGGEFDLKAEIRKQRAEGAAVIAPLSMLRCSECGELLDSFGCCVIHGLLDTEAMDGYAD